ncbi:hypothetical protein P872_13650 [Rhodonellum psychrophilum GCM71 = DSM 17998]|uniref:Uncharacterized protein n=1 Tax=Rhodonellum psychrophilum GCM71 = DSM 17998 TaxID=1123057 RepID=U5BJ01_9BACT|nr:hypothetical protein P872_13650 [Rhodonellum psychrophilum GCM71 = DSM 17998]
MLLGLTHAHSLPLSFLKRDLKADSPLLAKKKSAILGYLKEEIGKPSWKQNHFLVL